MLQGLLHMLQGRLLADSLHAIALLQCSNVGP
jgi:hypothetical protein